MYFWYHNLIERHAIAFPIVIININDMTQIRFTFNLSEPNYEYVGKKFWVTHKLIDSTENA